VVPTDGREANTEPSELEPERQSCLKLEHKPSVVTTVKRAASACPRLGLRRDRGVAVEARRPASVACLAASPVAARRTTTTGGLARRRAQNNNNDAPKDRTTVLTTSVEVLKMTTTVGADEVAIPAGFKENK
jgi:hypothetical protein